MSKISRVLRLFLTAALLGSALLVPAVAMAATDESPDFTEAHVPNTGMNQPGFWEQYLAAKYPGTTWDCTKVNSNADPVVLAANRGALIIKAGDTHYGWVPANAGEYSPPVNSTSHYVVCDQDIVEDDVIMPHGEIRGPCADPAYFAVFDNSDSTVDIRFRFTWYNNNGLNVVTKLVPAGAVYTTWQHWVKPFTEMRIGYKDPDTGLWVNLDRETAVKGRYPACTAQSHGYVPGFSYPNS